jgi:hypothetical protein
MINKIKAESLFVSPDFIVAIIIAIAVFVIIPEKLQISIVKDIFEVAISVLSIIFSVYFAALAVVITAGDNEFVNFMEEDGSYSHIIWTFKITLFLLFFALISSIAMFVITLPYQSAKITEYWWPSWGFSIYMFVSLWALFAAAMATLDSILYAEYRTRYLKIMKDKRKNDD